MTVSCFWDHPPASSLKRLIDIPSWVTCLPHYDVATEAERVANFHNMLMIISSKLVTRKLSFLIASAKTLGSYVAAEVAKT